MEETTKAKKPRFKKMGWKFWLVFIVVVASLGTAAYYWNDARNAKQQTPDAIAQKNAEETDKVVTELKTIILIEEDQDPTVARVEDPSVLQDSNPDFYKNVETGDYLVLYPQRAIIYRSAEKKIVNIAPIINTDQLNQDTQEVPETTEEASPEN